MLKRWPFSRNAEVLDYSKFFGEIQPTSKQLLIEKCKKAGVSVHVDDATETSTGICAEFRGVASEAELERRLNARTAVYRAMLSNRIAVLALVASLGALAKSVYS